MSSANWALGSISTPVGNYESTLNWDTHVVPTEIAAFGQSYMPTVLISSAVSVGGWSVFSQPYNFYASGSISFNGQGIAGGNGSQLFNSGTVNFTNGASAGIGGSMVFHNTETINFANSSSAGYAIFDNARFLNFANQSSAANSVISVTKTGRVDFTEGATAGAATLITAAEGNQVGRINFKGDGPLHNYKLTAGSFSGSGIFDLGSNEVTVGNASNTTVSGQIIGGSGGRLVKVGDSIMTLTGTNTYGGGTAVNEGELVVNGAIGKVTVGSAADFGVLFGNGIVGATTVMRGQLSAGPGLYEAGRLSTGNLDLQRGGLFVVDVAGIASPGANNGYDQLSVTGKVKLAGSLSVHMHTQSGPVPRHTLTIINNDGKDKVSGTFSNGTLYGALKEGDAFASGESAIYSISYKGGTGNDVVLRSEGHFSFGTDGSDTINANTAPGGAESNRTTKFADYIVDYGGDDTIASGGGNDTVYSGYGEDLVNGGAGNDFISFENAGKGGVQVTLNGAKLATVKINGVAEDRIKNFENVGGSYQDDKLSGDSKDNILLGDRGNDTLKGGGGNDALVGGYGKDVLEGGGGNDKFVFNKYVFADDNADTVKDFHHGQDKLLLGTLQFTAIGSTLDNAEFYAKAGATKAHDASDHIIYNTSNGKLYYDDDGKGGHAAVQFATLSGHPSLSASDFAVIASQPDIV